MSGTGANGRAFALIDHGLVDALGHNLTYARRVLAAAGAKGFRTVAGVAVGASDQAVGAASLALFPRDVWRNNPAEGRLWHATAAMDRMLHRPRGGTATMGGESASPAASAPSDALALVEPGGRLSRLSDGLRQDAAVLMAGRQTARRFADELADFISASALAPADLVYMPTVLATEMQAVDLLLDRSAAARALSWRLMLRYAPQARSVRNAIAVAARRLTRRTDADVRLFSDTEQLCALYGALSGAPFALLPIPVDASPEPGPARGGPLVVGYFGDARDEKGFDLLPDTVRHVREAPCGSGVRFVIQVNLNTAEGDARARAARRALAGMAGEDLELVEGPLSPEAYDALFRRADIVLLPYQPGAYAQRSSGVLMEALTAGTPCVVTRGGWMQATLETSGVPAGLVVEPEPQTLAEAVLHIAGDHARYAQAAWALGHALRARSDPQELVRIVAWTTSGRDEEGVVS